MGYFPNMTSWEIWAADNCFKCDHWPQNDDAQPCPVETAHMLYNYDFCNDKDHPAKVMLDMLIPPDKSGLGCERCAMFRHRNGVTDKHLKDWEKYKAIMAEMAGQSDPLPPTTGDNPHV